MILTVTELPKTIPDDVVIQGMTSMVVSEDEGFLPVDIEIAQGRNIYPLPTMTCYKIEANLGGIYAEIIAIAQKRFNSTTLVDENFQPVPIWPIFVKYDIATPENVNYRRTYACFETINDMFHVNYMVRDHPGTDIVMCRSQYLDEVDMLQTYGEMIPPDQRLARDYRFGEIAPDACVMRDLVNSAGMSGMPGHLPRERLSSGLINYDLLSIFHCRQSTELGRLMRGGCQIPSFTKGAVEGSLEEWYNTRRTLEAQGALLTVAPDVGITDPFGPFPMATTVNHLFTFGGSDYEFILRTNKREVSDVYYQMHNIRFGFDPSLDTRTRPTTWAIINDSLCEIIQCAVPNVRSDTFRIYKGWTEDIFVYDDKSRLILVIPLIWFMLACSPSLVNECNRSTLGD